MRNLEISFDVDHSSIGWAVLNTSGPVELKGCGAVVFRADDCLASSRRAYRRQRRHIRSTRQRIARMKIVLERLGVLTGQELNQVVTSSPWQLAARVVQGGRLLTWPEFWDVLRWYAHNRGYDGNRRWSAAETEAQKEDSEKEANARTLMGKHQVGSMAETFCKELGVDPFGKVKSSTKRFKGLNAAFPRDVVEGEVRRILRAHFGKLNSFDGKLPKRLCFLIAGQIQSQALCDSQTVPRRITLWSACPSIRQPHHFNMSDQRTKSAVPQQPEISQLSLGNAIGRHNGRGIQRSRFAPANWG